MEELVIPLDACNPELFSEIKGKDTDSIYEWDTHIDGIRRTAHIFGKGAVGTHRITV